MTSGEMLALDRTTGLVHQYKGTAPGGIGSEEMGFGIGVVQCDCEDEYAEMFEQALQEDKVVIVGRRHLRVGVWQPAPCLEEDSTT